MTPPKTLDVTEQHALLDALIVKQGTTKQFKRGVRNYTIGIMFLETGIRVGELVQLHWADLYTHSLPVTSIIIRPEITQNHQTRKIPVSTRLSNALKEYHRYYDTLNDILHDSLLFFTRTPHHPLTTRQVERIITAAAQKSLGRPLRPHVLRHTFALKLLKKTDIETVRETLGHKHRYTTTSTYYLPTP